MLPSVVATQPPPVVLQRTWMTFPQFVQWVRKRGGQGTEQQLRNILEQGHEKRVTDAGDVEFLVIDVVIDMFIVASTVGDH